jgi:acyl-CoA thioesterase-1
MLLRFFRRCIQVTGCVFVTGCLLVLAAPVHAARPAIVVLGDSLSAGYGLTQGAGWVDLLAQRVQRDKLDYDVVNASISGETTLGGRNRIGAVLDERKPAVVVVALGANDGLRGATVESTRANLAAIVAACRKAGARVLVVGMRIPPNYGPVYTRRFEAVFAEVARQQNAPLVPFLLAGFAEDRAMFQADGIHPLAAAQPRMLDNVYRRLRGMLQPRPR